MPGLETREPGHISKLAEFVTWNFLDTRQAGDVLILREPSLTEGWYKSPELWTKERQPAQDP